VRSKIKIFLKTVLGPRCLLYDVQITSYYEGFLLVICECECVSVCVCVVMMLSYQDESQVSACCRCRLITHCSLGQVICCLLQLASKARRNMRGSDVVCPSNLSSISSAWTWTVWQTHVWGKSDYSLAFCLRSGILSHLCENCMLLSKSFLKGFFIHHTNTFVVRGGTVGWGTVLHARRSRVWFLVGVTGIFHSLNSFWLHCGPGVELASSRNEYQEYSWGVKAAGV